MLGKKIKVHFRRIGVMFLNFLFGHSWLYAFVGFFNKYILDKPIKNIFLFYPANKKYTREYVYQWYARSMKWKPRLMGFSRQNKKWGFIFGISAIERDFFSNKNTENLRLVEGRLEGIKRLLGANQKTFAGVLPSLLSAKEIIHNSVERQVTVKAVLLAIKQVREKEQLHEETPVIVLGGLGFIGSEFNGMAGYYPIDIGLNGFAELANKFDGKPTIVLNLTKRGVLSEYIPYFWPQIVVINEVYPEPSESELRDIKEKGALCYHIIGVKGNAWPAFPHGYEGGIPCCASFWPEKEEDGEYEVIVKKM